MSLFLVRISAILLAVAVFLQLVAVVTPGWYVSYDNESNVKTSIGLFYFVQCPKSGGCTTAGIIERIRGLVYPGRYGAIYLLVDTYIKVFLSIFLYVCVAVLKGMAVMKAMWLNSFTTIALVMIGMANTLQWQLVADYSNTNVVFDGWLPWSVMIFGVGSATGSLVLIGNFVYFIRQSLSSHVSAQIGMS